MRSTYKEYLETQKSLTLEEMQELHEQLLSEIGTDPDALELYEDLVIASTEYAEVRANWLLWDLATKRNRDPGRTARHNTVIVACNMAARYLKSKGYEAAWRDVLGYEEEDRYYRKRIGDFACYLAFINGLNAR